MKYLMIAGCFFIISCKQAEKSSSSLQAWILAHQDELKKECDSLIHEYHINNQTDSNWLSSGIAITQYSPTTLGKLAQKAGDSTECVVVEVSFYKSHSQKTRIMLAAEDTACIKIVKQLVLPTDSTQEFIYGKREQPLF